MKREFLVETALLTHGLSSISDEELLRLWTLSEPCLAWLEEGEFVYGDIEEYIPFRRRSATLKRVSLESLQADIENGRSGALTASGTMAAAMNIGAKLAVTCGMGGISNVIKGEELCPDLPALAELPVALIAAAPKDVVDIGATVAWLLKKNVKIYGRESDVLTGFMAVGEPVRLSGVYANQALEAPLLLLNPLEEALRPADSAIIRQAVKAGISAQQRGEYFHPAANREIDLATKGRAARAQFEKLIENAHWAKELTHS